MKLEDYAGLAMQALVMHLGPASHHDDERIAKRAFEIAKEMVAEGERQCQSQSNG